MKTRMYARLSLLIPLLLWCVLLLLLLLGDKFFPDELVSNGPTTVVGAVWILNNFYVIGILFWFIPYLCLSLILFIGGFKSRVQTIKILYSLSPLMMIILIIVEVTLLSPMTSGGPQLTSNLASNFKDTIFTWGLFAAVTLFWGYFCVGLGFGIYKLLQRSGVIKDEAEELKPPPVLPLVS